jgi:proline iminopeptidase
MGIKSARTLAALAGFAAGVYAMAVRPRLLRWGATHEEVETPFPGAELIPGGRRGATMAVTIDAPPARVWPWLVQMGCDRAGWYSWDRLDNAGRPSAEHIIPEWQTLAPSAEV